MKFTVILERTLVSRTETEIEADTMAEVEEKTERLVNQLNNDTINDYDWSDTQSEEFDCVEVLEAT